MRIPIESYRNTESGPVVILGNGPSLSKHIGQKFSCPIMGINRSVDYWPEQDYFVTVAYDRLADVASGKITAKKAVFSCLHKAEVVPENIPQKITYASMPLPDDYAVLAQKGIVAFSKDLTKPIKSCFGGVYATQAALYLGFSEVNLIGFDGGTTKFYGWHPRLVEYAPCGLRINETYHKLVFWHLAEYVKVHKEVKVYNCNKDSAIDWFEYREPPLC